MQLNSNRKNTITVYETVRFFSVQPQILLLRTPETLRFLWLSRKNEVAGGEIFPVFFFADRLVSAVRPQTLQLNRIYKYPNLCLDFRITTFNYKLGTAQWSAAAILTDITAATIFKDRAFHQTPPFCS